MMTDRIGNWFQIDSGIKFYPLDPRPTDIRISDISQSLSKICRFGGHTKSFYSVAQHSVLVSENVPPRYALEGLLHDAAEAYIGDMVRPLKQMMPEYQKIEAAIEAVIAQRFNCLWPWPGEVKHVDNVLLVTERRDVLRRQVAWGWSLEPLKQTITPQGPDDAELSFMVRFKHLWAERRKETGLG